MRLIALCALAGSATAQWTVDGLTATQQQIVGCTRNDINEDGWVGVDDLLSVLSHYHFTCSGSIDITSCDLAIGADNFCGASAACPNTAAAEPCPPPSPPTTDCPVCPAGQPVVPDAALVAALFGDYGCELSAADLAAGSAADSLINAFIAGTAETLGVDPATLSLVGMSATGSLVNQDCSASDTVVGHSIGMELSNEMAAGLQDISADPTVSDGDDCVMTAAEIAASPQATMFACAMANAQAASMDGVNCNADCSLCDIVYDSLDFSGTGTCGSGRRMLGQDDGVSRVHLTMAPEFTQRVNAVRTSVKAATEAALEGNGFSL